MTDHPITPPPELIAKWAGSMCGYYEAARWGADMELEACCEYMQHEDFHGFAKELRAARRPKPLSLKEQALEQLDGIATVFRASHGGDLVCDTIRRALEALPE